MKTHTKEEICDILVQRDIEMDAHDLAYILKEGFIGYRKMRMVDLIDEYICCMGLTEAEFEVIDELENIFLVTVKDSVPDIRVHI